MTTSLIRTVCRCAICLLGLSAIAGAQDVDFPDANLEARVRVQLGIPAPTPITQTNMLNLAPGFYAPYYNIANLEGLQYAENLTRLTLENNQISDISPVGWLANLTELHIESNQISNMSPVDGLTNLTWLDMGQNQISNMWPVAGLSNLSLLQLDHNQISNISAVVGLTNLTQLYLENNQISDMSAVAGLTNLTHLHMGYNQISDISVVAGLTNLNALDMRWGQVSDMSAVTGMPNLAWLNLDNHQISDASAVVTLPRLRGLALRNNQIETFDLTGANVLLWDFVDVGGNPLTNVILADATLNQRAFNVLMDGSYRNDDGIAEVPGVLRLDMSEIDFLDITTFWKMYTMDDLETLLLKDATNVNGENVVTLTTELDALNWLDVTGPWHSFTPSVQDSLNAWDAIVGNTLVTSASPVPGDFNGDDTVDGDDFLIWQASFNNDDRGDADGDGDTDGDDFLIWQSNFGSASGTAAGAVPEPSAFLLTVLVGLLGVAMVMRRW